MATRRKVCFHRWSKNGRCVQPGCTATKKEMGERPTDQVHMANAGSIDGNVNGAIVRRKDRIAK